MEKINATVKNNQVEFINSDAIISGLINRTIPIRGSYAKFCNLYEIDYSWLSKFVNRKIENPTIRSLETLDKAINAWMSK